MSELKPCPFCGNEVHITLEQGMWFIECENEGCGVLMGFEAKTVSRAEVIAAWNRRAQHMPAIDAVEVVRCRDCVHFGECLATENDYCSKGERKENY